GSNPSLTRMGIVEREIGADVLDAEVTFELEAPVFDVQFRDAVSGDPVAAAALFVVQSDFQTIRGRNMITRGGGVLSEDGRGGRVYLSPPWARADESGKALVDQRQDVGFGLVVDAADHARTLLGPFSPESLDPSKPLELRVERGAFASGRVRLRDG